MAKFGDPANPMPQGIMLSASGELQQGWYRYLGDVQEIRSSLRGVSKVAKSGALTFPDLTPASTTTQIANAVNALKASLNALQKTME